MSWAEAFVALLVAHLAGDFILQTEFQALNKGGGLGRDGVRRRALLTHVATYALPMLPVFVWIGAQEEAARAAGIAVLLLGTHLVQDDGRLMAAYARTVKKTDPQPGTLLWVGIDQSFHALWLLCAALLAAA
jgi:uncharacterized protein DUF3307